MPPEENTPSIGESLATAIETVESAPQVVEPAATPAPTPAEPQTPAPTTERDASGKFLKKDKTSDTPPHVAPTDPKAAAPVPDTPKTGVEDKGTVPPAAAPAPTDAAPVSWKEDAKAKWAALDPSVRAEVSRREREITLGLQRTADVRREADSVMAEFAPYAQVLQSEGATPAAAIRALLETSYVLRYGSQEHKHALFLSLAQQYGIDLNKQVDPALARTQWELDSRTQHDMRAQAQAQTQAQNALQKEIQDFREAPGHEHYETVRSAMAGLLANNAAKDLQDAYDQACWANPTIRVQLQQAEGVQRVEAQAKNRNALAAVTGAPGAAAAETPPDASNMRGFIEAQFKESAGRI